MAASAPVDFWSDIPPLGDEALSVPTGWASVKSLSFQSPDRSVTLTSIERSGLESRAVDELASRHATEVVAGGGAIHEALVDAIALHGRRVAIQSYVVDHPDAGRMLLRAAYHVAAGVETIVTAMASLDNEMAVAQADDVLRTYDPWATAVRRVMPPRPTLVGDGLVAPDGTSVVGRFSRDELLAAAGVVGIAALPTIAHGRATDAALSALVARGVVHTDDTGGLVLDPVVERALRTLVGPTTLVSIESGPPGRTQRSVIHVDATLLVSVRPLDHGVVQVDTDASDRLPAHIGRHLDLRDAEAADAPPTTVDHLAVERARAGNVTDHVATRVLATGRRVVRLRALVTTSGTVTGGDVTIVDGGDDGYWLVEQADLVASAPVFSCRPVSTDDIIAIVTDLTHPGTLAAEAHQ